MGKPVYALGHSDRELERLSAQARLIEPITRSFFLEAGIVAGMRVLDVGSGAGDTAFLAADLVGESGEVIGSDRVAAAVVAASKWGEARGLRNVSFREGDSTKLAFDRPFDAVVGRYVLLFQADPAAMVRKLAGHLRPGGVIVFHEPQWDSARSDPPAPTFDRCCRWIAETLRLSGTPLLAWTSGCTGRSSIQACRRHPCECMHSSVAVWSAWIGCSPSPSSLAVCCRRWSSCVWPRPGKLRQQP